MAVSASHIAAEHVRQFRGEGFFVLEKVASPSDLETLRGECRLLIEERDREMDRLGVEKLDLDHRGRRYFVHAYEKSPAVRRFLLSNLMAQIAKATLGENVYLYLLP